MCPAIVTRFIGAAMIAVGVGITPAFALQESAPTGDLRSYYTANGLLERGLNAMAIEEYRRFLDENPDHEKARSARYGLGVALARTEDWRGALAALDSIRSIDGFEFGADAAQLAAHCASRLGEHSTTVAWCRKGLAANPEDEKEAQLSATLVEALWRLENWSEVTTAADSFRRTWPENAQRTRVEYFAGIAAQRQNQHERAINSFQIVVSDSSDSALADHARLAMASSIRASENADGAEVTLREATRSANPAVAESARFQLVDLLLDRGADEEALQILEQIVRLNPDGSLTPQAADEMARLAIELEREPVARQAISFLLQLDDPRWLDDASYWRGKLAHRRRNLDEAISTWTSALREHPKGDRRPVMLYDLGVALHAAGRRDDALERWNSVRSEYPNDLLAADATYAAMSAWSELGDWDTARRTAVDFIDRWPRHERVPTVEFVAADYLSRLGDDANAARELDEWLKRYPEHPQRTDAELRLGLAHARLSRVDEARAILTPLADRAGSDERLAPAVLAVADIAFRNSEWPEAERRLKQYLSIVQSGNAEARFQLGLSMARQGRHADAAEVFESTLADKLSPGMRARTQFELGQSYEALGSDSAAAASFLASLEVGSKSAVADHARMRLGSIASRAGRHDEAANWFGQIETSEQSAPIGITASLERARAMLAAGIPGEAAGAFRAWLDANESHSRASEARGGLVLALSRSGDLEAARDEMQRVDVDELDEPTRSTILLEAAWVNRRLDAPRDSTRLYEMVANGDGSTEQRAHALAELSSIALESDRLDDASAHLRSLEQLTSSGDELSSSIDESLAYLRGVVAWRQGRWSDATAALDGFAERYPESDVVHSSDLVLADAFIQLERWSEADRTLTRLIDSNPDESTLRSAILRAAEVEASLQKWAASERSARTFLDRFGSSDSHWYQAQFNLARAMEGQQRYEDAIGAYRELVDRHDGPTTARAQFQIGECLYALRRYEDAARELIRVDILYDEPQWTAAALYEAGRCFLELNQLADARAQFDAVLERFPDTNWARLARDQIEDLDHASRLPGR
ncbi:MAG: tetratricopeptide repeat protein [Phycisphaerales bacterium]